MKFTVGIKCDNAAFDADAEGGPGQNDAAGAVPSVRGPQAP